MSIFYIIYICLLICLEETEGRKVLLRDIKTITLTQGQMTTARRSSPVPQLKCTGGSAGCHRFVPKNVQCHNKGWDGFDAQWKCETDMEKKYRFGKIAVSCEGYDYPNDPYILAGSCGLEYEIDYINTNRKHSGGFSKSSHRSVNSGYEFGEIIWIVCVLLCILLVYRLCISRNNNRCRVFTNSNNSGEMPPGTYPRDPPPPYGFRPEYYPQQNTHSFEDSQQPGFFSGMGTGGVLGYVLGKETGYSRCDTSPGYHHSSDYHHPSDWFGTSQASHNYVSSSDSSDDDDSRVAVGFGGTTRR
ncbi:store-operated calcium entry-associated regulatory factor-like [Octopus sinensis]|uniref:Store-operated calcium entry-associated regulatory factor n=1 Tax=Octopus sinensis TaxID=2607531 RepID=A0A6P7TDZ4_9MOLL|nr:store-operated calcium entry-associated regulatory factor-like [Octopus sinensis]